MTMLIKERKFYLKRKANNKTVKPHNKRLVENCCLKKVGQAQLAGKPMLAAAWKLV
jgi:hypothetical protein